MSEVGLETVAEACARKGWAPKSFQNWVAHGLIAAAKVGPGRGTLLVRVADVDGFTPPPRGRPPSKPAPKSLPVFVPEAAPGGVTAAPPARSNRRGRKRSGT